MVLMLFLITKSAKILQNVLFVDRNLMYKQILLIVRSLLSIWISACLFGIPDFSRNIWAPNGFVLFLP